MGKKNKGVKAPKKPKKKTPASDNFAVEKALKRKETPAEDILKIGGLINKLGADNQIEEDADLAKSDNDSMKFHNDQYDALLEAYVEKAKKTFDFKLRYAEMFLTQVLDALRIILGVFAMSIFACIFGKMDKLSLILPICVSFLTVYIVIPQIITKYLFNEKEEQYMSEIIKNIQSFDKEVRKGLKVKAQQDSSLEADVASEREERSSTLTDFGDLKEVSGDDMK